MHCAIYFLYYGKLRTENIQQQQQDTAKMENQCFVGGHINSGTQWCFFLHLPPKTHKTMCLSVRIRAKFHTKKIVRLHLNGGTIHRLTEDFSVAEKTR